MRHLILPVLLLGLASSAQAHEIWIEQDATGPAHIYLLTANHMVDGPRSLGAKVSLISTLTVVEP